MKKTTKSIALAAMLAMLTIQTHAQSFGEGDNTVSIGYGFPNLAKSLFSVWNDATTYDESKIGGLGPFHLKYEHALNDKIGIGASINLVSAEGKYSYNDQYFNSNGQLINTTYTDEFKMSGWSALVRINWHFFEDEKFDPYWGLGVGYKMSKWNYTYGDSNNTSDNIEAKTTIPLGLEITVGARYYIIDNLALYAETGLAKSVIQFGLAYKFPGK